MIRFKQYLEEKSIKDIFQDKLFGDLLKSGEKDTEDEADILDKIEDFISDNIMDSDIMRALNTLKKAKSKFKDLLEPKDKIAYRGTVIDQNQFKKIKWEVAKNKSFMVGDMTFKPHRRVQSFTSKWKIAKDFVAFNKAGDLNYDSRGGIGIILEIPVNKTDFLLSTKLSNKMRGKYFGRGNYEWEIIRINQKPIQSKVYITREEYDKTKRFIDDDERLGLS